MEKFIKLAEIRKLNKQVSIGEISSSRMIEILCEKADEHAKPKWIGIDELQSMNLPDYTQILTKDIVGNLIPYRYFKTGLNMIGEHSDNNQKITHFILLPI